jgi:hypothetical protein
MVAVDLGEEAFDEPKVIEAQSRPIRRRSNRSGNAAPYGYAALGRSAAKWRLKEDLSNLFESHRCRPLTPYKMACKTTRITPIAR